ncbi:MAG: class SAM-dependent methyltransferase [Acidimicrobiales bacterium]|jgi:SAM-dependent methyltransferase|nr:class SAM-dependent methyltransferase [Acidimicrobiales bacterium]
MRAYWDRSAQENAAWYVDTSLDYSHPDMAKFFETGRTIVDEALAGEACPPVGSGLAVEIGSGLGRVCSALADRFAQVVGVDISPEMVKRASELVADPKVRFVVGDGEGITGVADGTADVVLSFTVFQHIPSIKVIEGYLVDAGRVLAPGGVFVFQWNNTPGATSWRVRRSVLSLLQRSGLHREQHGRHDAAFLGSRVPRATIESALRRGGLELCGTQGLDTLYAWAWAQKRA